MQTNSNKVMKNRPTIKDIARELNIHHSTVSRALHNHPDVKHETKKLVQSAAEKLNYSPNLMARNLKRNTTNFIGVIVPEIEHHFFSSAVSGIEKIAYDEGFVILICQSNEDYQREVLNTRALPANNIAGLIVSLSQTTHNCDHFVEYISNNGKIVFFDRVPKDLEAPKVVVDDYDAAYTATEHLIKIGRKRIAHLAGAQDVSISNARLQGYKDALLQNGLHIDTNFIEFGGFHEQNGYEGIKKILERNKNIDAVFAVNDPNALGAYEYIKEIALKIPEDIAVVGFSNNPMASFVTPSLTTINQPSFEMGKKAAELLIEMIKNHKSNNQRKTIVLETELIIRKST